MRVALMLRRTLIGVLALLLVSACTLKLAHALPRGGSATTAHDDTAAQFHATTRSIPELPADVWSLIAERTDVRTFHRLGATSRMHHAIARDEHGSEARMLLRHYGANNVLCVLLMVPPVPYAADSVRRWSAFHAVLAEMVSASARSAMATSAMAPHARQEHIADANNSTDAHARTTSLAVALNAGFSCAAHMSNLPALISVELCMRDHELEPDYGRAVVAAVEGRGDDVIAAAGDLRVLTHLLKVVRMQRERHRDADASSSNGHASAASVGIAASFSDSHGSAAHAHTRTNDRHIRLGQALGNALVISIQHQIAWLPAVVPPLLIEYGAHVDHAHGEPLVFASIRGLLDIVELLFDAGADPTINHCRAFREAIYSGDTDVVAMFYDHREDIADACSVDGVQGANVQGVQGVDVQSSNVQGADVDNDQDAMRLALASPWTPAIGAAREGHTHIIDWLIDQGLMHPTDIHLFANHALCESLRFRHANAAFQLIELGADIHACQGTVVVDAARLGSMLLMESVLARGEVDVNVDGGRVLMEVVRQGDLQMLALLERSSNLNLYAHGPRALEAAVTAGNAEMVQALLDYGAAGRDVRMVVEKAIVVARKHGHAEIVRLLTAELKQQSSSSSTEDSRGVSATSDDDDDEWF